MEKQIESFVQFAAEQEMRDTNAIAEALLAWYATRRRDLPWRRTADPYHIWVAEIMLQQTQVSTVIPYYERFLARFPSLQALAEADLDEVLALWAGLGYYSRARNLHAAARIVHREYGGQLPAEYAKLLALPGIGDYTAGALLSIAFHRDVPAIDANATRVLCRLYDEAREPGKAAVKRALRGYAEALLPHGQAGALNQALMELGSTVCLPKAPRCGECPLAPWCRARALGTQEERPIPKQKVQVPHRRWVAALVTHGDRLLIVRRVPQGLLGGLWELPGGEVAVGQNHHQALAAHLRAGLGTALHIDQHLATVRHAYSHFCLSVRVYGCRPTSEPVPSGDPWDNHHWLAPAEMEAFGLTGVTRKILAAVRRGAQNLADSSLPGTPGVVIL